MVLVRVMELTLFPLSQVRSLELYVEWRVVPDRMAVLLHSQLRSYQLEFRELRQARLVASALT